AILPGKQFDGHGQTDDRSGLVMRMFAYECFNTIFSSSQPHLPQDFCLFRTSLVEKKPVR
ncbi:transposase, partial [Danaus plexippus plexippus]